MLDTFSDIAGKVKLRCPAASIYLCRDWVNNAFRRVAERRRWSWLVRYGQFIAPAAYTTGTVTCTLGSTTVTGAGTAWTTDMAGRQFRIGVGRPIYTIAAVNNATSLDLDMVWGAPTIAATTYSIYQAYFTPPSDFKSLITVWDPAFNWQLRLNVHQEEINAIDAQRTNTGNSWWVSARDYSSSYSGVVSSVVQAVGAGPDPVSSGNYSGVNDALFTVEVTLGGASGVATYQWKKDGGAYTAGVLSDPAAAELQEGVYVYWPAAVVYVLGDVFIIRVSASASPGLPRYEFWPHQRSAYVYPFLYEARATDLEDPGAVLPRYVRGDILLDMALSEAAAWPGPSADQPNPMYDQRLAAYYGAKSERMLNELELKDNETSEIDANYQMVTSLPYAIPWGDSAWLQSHDV